MQLAMIQDKIIPIEDLQPSYCDRGVFFGDGVYEVIRSYDGKLFALDEHFQRLTNSLTAINITGVDIDQIRQRILKAFEAANIPSAKIYFHITRGSATRDHLWDKDLKPNFFLTITEASDSAKLKAEGISVSTHQDLRWKRCDIKSLNLLPNVLARNEAAKKGCDEAIFVDDTGLITEGSASAFFAIFGKTLQTAPVTANILPSITSIFALRAARLIGMEVLEESFTPQQAAKADELFIATTPRDIVPVVKFDDRVIKGGKPGKYTKLLIEQFYKFTSTS